MNSLPSSGDFSEIASRGEFSEFVNSDIPEQTYKSVSSRTFNMRREDGVVFQVTLYAPASSDIEKVKGFIQNQLSMLSRPQKDVVYHLKPNPTLNPPEELPKEITAITAQAVGVDNEYLFPGLATTGAKPLRAPDFSRPNSIALPPSLFENMRNTQRNEGRVHDHHYSPKAAKSLSFIDTLKIMFTEFSLSIKWLGASWKQKDNIILRLAILLNKPDYKELLGRPQTKKHIETMLDLYPGILAGKKDHIREFKQAFHGLFDHNMAIENKIALSNATFDELHSNSVFADMFVNVITQEIRNADKGEVFSNEDCIAIGKHLATHPLAELNSSALNRLVAAIKTYSKASEPSESAAKEVKAAIEEWQRETRIPLPDRLIDSYGKV